MEMNNKSGLSEITGVNPNPWVDQTIVEFNMVQHGLARIQIYNSAGQLIYTHEDIYDKGDQQLVLHRSEFKYTVWL